jgi:hypothetical protein
MTAKNIINQLAKNRVIEKIIANVAKKQPDQTDQDLAQDLYTNLLEKEAFIIEDLYNKNEIHYFITKMVLYNVNSKNSRYYYNYKLPQRRNNLMNEDQSDNGETQNYQE